MSSLRELHQQAQKYNTQLQEYNTKLQQDVALSNDSLQKLQVISWLPIYNVPSQLAGRPQPACVFCLLEVCLTLDSHMQGFLCSMKRRVT